MKLRCLLILLVLSSCSLVGRGKAVSSDQKPPVEIEVPQSFVSEGQLHIRASVKPLVNLRADEVTIGIIGLSSGASSIEEHRPLSEVSGKKIIEAGETVLVEFDLPSANLSEYQVVCRWGGDAARGRLQDIPVESAMTESVQSKDIDQNLDEVPATVVLRDLALRRVPTDCEAPPCDEICTFEGEIANSNQGRLTDVVLALGVSFVQKGQTLNQPGSLSPMTADEQEIQLEGFELAPGRSRALEVKVAEPLAEIPEGTFVPYLRLLKYRQLK